MEATMAAAHIDFWFTMGSTYSSSGEGVSMRRFPYADLNRYDAVSSLEISFHRLAWPYR
jgi:hypothetical protein